MEQTLNLMEVLDALPEEKQRIIEAYKNGQFTALKKDDKSNSLIIRLVNMEAKSKNVDMKIWFPATSFIKTNMIEEDINDTGQKGKDLKINLGKNSIETFRISF